MRIPTVEGRRLVAAFLAVQIAVPTAALTARWLVQGSRPRSELPSSWQMYSATSPSTFTGTTADGDRLRLSADDLAPVLRHVQYGDVVLRRLCHTDRDLVSVTRTREGPGDVTIPC